MKQFWWWSVGLVVAVCLFCVPTTVVQAHAYLQSSTPVDQSSVNQAPKKIVLTFTEMIQNEYPSVVVRDSDGRRVENGKAFINPKNDHVVEVGLQDDLPDDVYSAEWRVVSADGHPVSGVISFKVGETSQGFTTGGDSATNATSSWPSTIVKIVLYIGFSLVAGVLLFFLALYRVEVGLKLRKTTIRVLFAGLGLLVIGFLLFLPLQVQIYTGGNGWDFTAMGELVMQSRIGHLWLVQVASLLALMLSLFLLFQKNCLEKVWLWLVPLALFMVLLFIKAMQGHAAGSPDKTIAIPMDFLHLVSASAWVGGIVVLFLLLPKQLEAKVAWNRFSPWAASFVGMIIVSGLLMSVMNLGSMAKLFTTEYGKVILLKIALFLVMGALGLVHYLYMRQTGKMMSAKTIVVEFGLGIVILGVAAFLTNVQTPPPTPPEAFSQKVATDSGFVSLKIDPAIVGDNTFLVTFTNQDNQVRTDFQKVTLTATPSGNKKATEFEARKNSQNEYATSGLYLNATGRWEIKVHALTKDFSEIDQSFTIKIKQ
ncbi:copper resistance CopC/CopD family protein [Listeria cornellensis]|uniref:Copper resistance protein n=1 Tax=Listeria cornellensis FSL F6-0969 TaxID=1265820 RepID=W7BYA5_9LIST|nr:copper resistance CopC/CopD family protein [Listeria cornellensis]EUJ28406.1 copper resistance protein [Listeria cornellensis FSL F6-0969]